MVYNAILHLEIINCSLIKHGIKMIKTHYRYAFKPIISNL